MAAGVCLLLLAFNWFQSGKANFYNPKSAGGQDFRLIGGLVAGLFWSVMSFVSVRLDWFVISR